MPGKGSVPEGSGHGTGSKLLEFKERLDTTLINRAGVVLGGARGWTRGSLWVSCNSGILVFYEKFLQPQL